MDVSLEESQADDHNTNQNEATLTCRPVHGSVGPPNSSIKLKNQEIIRCGPTVPDKTDNQENGDTGTCNAVPTLSIPNTTENIPAEHDFVIDNRTDSSNQLDSFENGNELPDLVSEETRDETIDILSDSSTCLDTQEDGKTQTIPDSSAVTPNESSAVDLSVTSDDDIKVTCRCSSTPVNYNVHKTLNDADCSMSSVGDASPISSIDTESKMSTGHPKCNDSPVAAKDACKNTTRHQDKIDSTMMYIQPHMYSNKPNEMRNQPTEQDYSPRCSPYYVDRNQTPTFQQTYQNHSLRTYPASPYDYSTYVDSPCGYDYNLCGQRSLTDVKSRHDMQQLSVSPQPDLCCYPVPPNGMSERDYFVYPSIYVSNAGLISVLLRNDMSVEMTVDRTIRVVSHNHMMAVATDSKGTAASLYHPVVKIFQMGYNTDIATDMFRAKMSQGEAIFFSNGVNCFKLQDSELQPVAPIKFSDIHRDQSVNLLFSSEGYGESLVATCMQVAAQAEYANLPKGGVIVRINGVKVTQSGCGDVTVVTGAKFIRLSPHNGTTRLGNRFVDIEVERDWSVKLTRGTHSFVNTKKRTMVSNGKMEAGFDENNGLKVTNLQPRHPLLAEPNIIRRAGKRMARTPPTNMSACFTPRRRVLASGGGRGGVNTC